MAPSLLFRLRIVSGGLNDAALPDLGADTRLPITVEARKLDPA